MILKEGSGLFRVRKPRRFDPPTRYYDSEKERLDTRISEIEEQQGKQEGERVRREVNFRAQTNIDWKKNQITKARINSNIRLIIILVLLAAGLIYLYDTVDAPSLVFENTGK